MAHRHEKAIAQLKTGQSLSRAAQPCPFILSWTHYVFLMGIENADERRFYEIEAADQGWNLEELRQKLEEWAGEAGDE